MNAAIEAAHAGEAGKGFAVVADEIRKLAEDSSTQGKAITATLKTLSGEIETLSASSKTVEEKFNAIFTLAEQVKEMSARLTEAMREQENGSREVLTAIKSINTVTVEVQSGSEEMLKGGEGVAKEMQKLDSLTRIITDSMNEMASGAVQINNAVQEVSEITQKNQQPRRKRRGIKPSARIRGRLGIWRPRWGNSKYKLGKGRHFFRIKDFFPSLDPILSSKEPLS